MLVALIVLLLVLALAGGLAVNPLLVPDRDPRASRLPRRRPPGHRGLTQLFGRADGAIGAVVRPGLSPARRMPVLRR